MILFPLSLFFPLAAHGLCFNGMSPLNHIARQHTQNAHKTHTKRSHIETQKTSLLKGRTVATCFDNSSNYEAQLTFNKLVYMSDWCVCLWLCYLYYLTFTPFVLIRLIHKTLTWFTIENYRCGLQEESILQQFIYVNSDELFSMMIFNLRRNFPITQYFKELRSSCLFSWYRW